MRAELRYRAKRRLSVVRAIGRSSDDARDHRRHAPLRDMSFLRRLFGSPSAIDDPVFGRLVLRDGQWTGQLRWEHSANPFALTVHRVDAPPSDVERSAWLALQRDYPLLGPGLQLALDRLWSDAQATLDPPPPDLGGSLGLWARIELQGLVVHPDGRLDLIYGLDDATGVEGAFIVRVQGQEVAPLEYVE